MKLNPYLSIIITQSPPVQDNLHFCNMPMNDIDIAPEHLYEHDTPC